MDTTALATIIALLLLGVDSASNNSGENPPPANERFRRLIPYMTFYITQQSLVDRQQPLFQGVPKVPQYQSNSLILSQPYAFVKNPIPSPPPTPPPSTFYYSRPDPLYSRPTQDINDQARLRALAKILGILQNARKNPQASNNSGIQALAQILSILQQAHALPAGTEPIVSEVIKHHLQPAVEVNSNGGSGLVAETPSVPTVLSTPKPFVSSTPESIEVTDNDLQNYSDEDYTAEIEKPATLNRYAAKVPYGFKPHSYYKGPTSTQSFPDPYSEGSTPGRAGIDYPTYAVIPQTSFSCKTQRYKGFFGDPDTSCQVWHYCDLNGGQASFLCPNGTIFSQVALTCDWWFNVKCSSTSQLYVLNERLYKYILPVTPSFPEDYHGPLVDQYLTLKFQEQENKKKSKSKTTTTTTPSSNIDDN